MKSEDKRLIQAYYYGSITKGDAKKLNKLLEHDPKARSYYITYSAITADPAPAVVNYHYSCTGSFTITLPTSQSAGSKIVVKNMGTGDITLDPQSSNIDGVTTDYVLDVQYSSLTLISDGTGWEII